MNWRSDTEPLPGDEAKEPGAFMETASRRLTEDEKERNRETVRRNTTNLFLMSPVLDGFSLDTKAWSEFRDDTPL